MTREEMDKILDEYGQCRINDLYCYSCLITSGFDKEKAFELIGLLEDLWLKDENNYSISKLSDMLYENYVEEFEEMNTREILSQLYMSEF